MRFKIVPHNDNKRWRRGGLALFFALLAAMPCIVFAQSSKGLNSEVGGLYIPISRSELVIVPQDIAEVIVADPDIADVHVIGAKRVAFIGKKMGRTNAKLFDKNNKAIRQFDIIVGYDLPSMRKALHFFLPHEHIAVTLVGNNVALSGSVSDASTADEAMKIADQFTHPPGTGDPKTALLQSSIINLMRIVSGQQVMLRVRVGEIQRNALKNLGVSLSGFHGTNFYGATQNATTTFEKASSIDFGGVVQNTNDAGILGGILTSKGINLSATLEALETEGLFKILAEPNLVAMSGEKAEFLSGGEFPVPSAQIGGGSAVTTVQFQQYGISVQFVPFVLSDNRIRISVQPEVSQIDASSSTTVNGTVIPGLDTRRAKTTVELAPGESFMIAGLISDQMNSSINQIPGASSIPILGALLRSTSFQRNETELVIAVTPYIVDPLKSSDVKLPTDDFRPASVMEQFFYGVLGSMSGNAYRISQTPTLEGPIGFMTD